MARDTSQVLSVIDTQETVLQSTRTLHYVFQALFLGIGFVLLTISVPTFFDIEKSRHREIIFTLFLIPIFVLSFICYRRGVELCREYSKRVEDRGRIVDLLHHLALLSHANKLDEVLDKYRFGADTMWMFTIVKLAEIVLRLSKKGPNPNNYDTFRTEHPIFERFFSFDQFRYLTFVLFYADMK